MTSSPRAAALLAFALCSIGATPPADADRVLTPLDMLGDWALETQLSAGATSTSVTVREPGRVGYGTGRYRGLGLYLRLWPADGVYAAVSQSWGEAIDLHATGFGNLTASAGWRRNVFERITTSTGLSLTLPTGTEALFGENWVVRGAASVGRSSLNQRHQLFGSISSGYPFADADDYRPGAFFSYSLGYAYQRSRWTLMAQPWGAHSFDGSDELAHDRGGMTVSAHFETYPGLTLGLWAGGYAVEQHTVGDLRTKSSNGSHFSLSVTYVYHQSGRENRYRRSRPAPSPSEGYYPSEHDPRLE